MQKTGSTNIVIELDSITNSRNCGMKAYTIGSLVKHGFAVPTGFCLSMDAYRSHLWASGVRNLAMSKANPSSRESLRNGILESNLPDDLLAIVTEAYSMLGENVPVALRHSASDEDIAGPAYTTVLGVSGIENVIEGLKIVWASLWSEDAADLRDRHPNRKEPSMAVIIQTMVDAQASGTIITADTSTGNPNEIQIAWVDGVSTGKDQMNEAIVDLRDFKIWNYQTITKPAAEKDESEDVETSDSTPLSQTQIVELAEAGIWVEKALEGQSFEGIESSEISRPLNLNWALEDGQIYILGAHPVTLLHPYFPKSDENGDVSGWVLHGCRPISSFAQSLLNHQKREVQLLPSDDCEPTVCQHSGYIYKRNLQPKDKLGNLIGMRDISASTDSYLKWQTVATEIVKDSDRDLSRPLAKQSLKATKASVRRAIERVRLSMQWHESIPYPAIRFSNMLRELLISVGTEPSVFFDLITYHEMEMDKDFQRLSAYAWQARSEVDSSVEFDEMVKGLSKKYGYAFSSEDDVYDPAAWKSWIEEPAYADKIAWAIARGPITDVNIACERSRIKAKSAEFDALEAIRASKGCIKSSFAKARFRKLLKRTRLWIESLNLSYSVHAIAMTALRANLLELGRRMEKIGVLSTSDDIFHLTEEEILNLGISPSDDERRALRHSIAKRKHEIWLRNRLTLPKGSSLGTETRVSTPSVPLSAHILTGVPMSPGDAVGTARIARSFAEAAAIQPGEILITDEISPAWAPFLGVAAGVVLTQIDTISSGALHVRNYGIPCVIGLNGITSSAISGQTVRVDGSSGTVEIVRAYS